MSITLKEVSIESETPVQAVTPKSQGGLTLADINAIVGQAVGTALTQAQAQAASMIADLEVKIASIAKPKTVVMAVEVDKETRKLTKPANPNLGRMIVNAKLGLNTLLVGPAGSGKTVAAEQLAEALGRSFGHVCLTAGASETWLFGRQTAKGFIEGSFSSIYRNGGVFLADEMDGADANMLLSINTSLANGHLYNPIVGENIPRHPDFVFVGAANTLGRGGSGIYTGRSRLDAATLNRFITLQVDYCDAIEAQVCPDETLRSLLQEARNKLATLKSQEIVSTRTLDQAYKQFKAGIPLADIFESLTMGWPDGISKQCGIDPASYRGKKPPKAKVDMIPDVPTAKADGEQYPF